MDISKREQDDPVLQMRGVGKEIWAGTDPDQYVRDLRANWYGLEQPETVKEGMGLPGTKEFEQEIRQEWSKAEERGLSFVDIRAGDLHRSLGGYPGRNNRLPICCGVMRRLMDASLDSVLSEPPKGKGASLCVRYGLPRPSSEPAVGQTKTEGVIASSTSARGRSLQQRAQEALRKLLGVDFRTEIPIRIGDPPKAHKFDLASIDERWVAECKNFSFTASGGNPSGKIAHCLEAILFLSLLPNNTKRILVMNRAVIDRRSESLAEYFSESKPELSARGVGYRDQR